MADDEVYGPIQTFIRRGDGWVFNPALWAFNPQPVNFTIDQIRESIDASMEKRRFANMAKSTTPSANHA